MRRRNTGSNLRGKDQEALPLHSVCRGNDFKTAQDENLPMCSLCVLLSFVFVCDFKKMH